MKLCGIVAPQTADDIGAEFVENREYSPPSGGGPPPPDPSPEERKERRIERQKLTNELIESSGINCPPPRPPAKNSATEDDEDKKPAAKSPLKAPPKASPKVPPKASTPAPTADSIIKKKMADQDLVAAVGNMGITVDGEPISKVSRLNGFEARVAPFKKVFTDPVYSGDENASARSGVIIIIHLPSGCDGNEVYLEIVDGGNKVKVEIPYPDGFYNASTTLGPDITSKHPVMTTLLRDILVEEREAMIRRTGDTTFVARGTLDMPFPVEPRFRSLDDFSVQPDPAVIVITEYGAQLVVAFAFKMAKFGSPNTKKKKKRIVSAPTTTKLPVPGLGAYMAPPPHFGQPHQQMYQHGQPNQQQYPNGQQNHGQPFYPPFQGWGNFPPGYFQHPRYNNQNQQPPPPPPPQQHHHHQPHHQHPFNQQPNQQQQQQYFGPPPTHHSQPYADPPMPAAMSVASSTVDTRKSRLSRSLRQKNTQQNQTIQVAEGGVDAASSAANTGPSSPRVRGRPSSTEPPPGRVDVVRPRNGYNQQASTTRPTITVETVANKEKGGVGSSSSYDEITVTEGGEEQWHSPTNVTPDEEGYGGGYDDNGGSSDDSYGYGSSD